ncbi:TetR/AcrR family transcriptional regulator [Anaerosacchariphilus polymeriproducens]|uniref:TetR/AcrR family transcriptional regulator n=1 Tax=Anaerosacchariphilus polymeriproducens TaxID=1812858 RepID=A0A371AVM0_9FIRM|nr:TetR/AcrR family transcriptional regulator [Anaerosacchariphilus polymeriproducens]RDU23634.1 TetR/AcrR family transcriptional regulator [Anaerosacchariphilus polymeriproducens]
MEEQTKQVILKAAFLLLEKKDMNSISVREIAKEAGVNIAAISYYFGGKSELFSSMMEQYWEDLKLLCMEILEQESISNLDAKNFCLRYMEKEMSSTGILRSEQVMYQNYKIDEKTKERINLQFKAFSHLVKQCNPNCKEESLKIKVVSLLSALTHPALWNEIAENLIDDKKMFMDAYVCELVDNL